MSNAMVAVITGFGLTAILAVLWPFWVRTVGAEPPAPATPARRFDRGACQACGEIVPLRRDGQPSARWHKCGAVQP